VLLPLTTYALLLAASGLAMSDLVSGPARLLLGLVGTAQVVLLVSWTWHADCLGSWCTDGSGMATWLVGPALVSFALGLATREAAAELRRA
jgi:hypothetical protein